MKGSDPMDDERIVQLYLAMDEQAIRESSEKYGSYCYLIAHRILGNPDDADECVNDTWLRAWNAIPPQHPSSLSLFFGKITRNLAIDRYREAHRIKRVSGESLVVLDELGDLVSGSDSPEAMLQADELKADINRFLMSLPQEKRYMFILRYWYAEKIANIAVRFSMTPNHVSVVLKRIRKQLKRYLQKRGYDL